ncbi:hypothetical protein PIB30_076168 [Stylosanthes scabra]|uniref:Fe2OG dioxygenase domain-containing protein n=1 Tax=Stylosanthes scabra TaxID=79078 RepID=A0ABU6RQJ6_9FABA|nr:hypothetical protein [Stylosanthes scabra]
MATPLGRGCVDAASIIGEREAWTSWKKAKAGLNPPLISSKFTSVFEAAAGEFFGESTEEKNKVTRDAVIVLGYSDTEHTKNVRDWKEVFDFSVEEPTLVHASLDPHQHDLTHWHNQWPHYPPHLRDVCQEYAKDMVKLALELMELIALILGLAQKRFHGFFKDKTSFIRLNHDPPCPSPHFALGVGRHKDAGVLTILAQNDAGGKWVRVRPTPNAYIINVGDNIQIWSNESYESVEQSSVMVNSEKDSYLRIILRKKFTQFGQLHNLLEETLLFEDRKNDRISKAAYVRNGQASLSPTMSKRQRGSQGLALLLRRRPSLKLTNSSIILLEQGNNAAAPN